MTEYDISDFPLILLIDCHQVDSTSVALIHQNGSQVKTEAVRAQQLPELIEKYLQSEGLNLKSIKAFAYLSIPGSLTGERVGISVINTLAWAMDIPTFQFHSEDITKAAKEIESGHTFQISKKLKSN